MSNALTEARRLASQRAEQAATERADALATARQLVVALVTGDDPPTPDEILQVCDRLNVSLDWFDAAVMNCTSRIADLASLERVPALEEQARALEAEAAKLSEQAAAVEPKVKAANERVKNRDDRLTQYLDESATREQLDEWRDLRNEFSVLADGQWLASRDARLIRREIESLQKIDRSNIDPHATLPTPHDFVMPEVR